MTDAEHDHRGTRPCPVCGYDGTPVAKQLHPTEVRNGLAGIAKARAAMRKESE